MFNLVGTCLFTFAWILMTIGLLLRLLPGLSNFLMRMLRGLLILSFRLYHAILSLIAPSVYRLIHIDVLVGLPRVVTTIAMSLSLGLLLFLLLSGAVTAMALVVFAMHGLLVGLAWDEIQEPGGLKLGSRLE